MDEPMRAGWLIKSGKHMAWNVKRRWVVLSPSALTWYIKPTDQTFSGSLPLSAIEKCQLSATLKRHSCFEVLNRSPTKIFFVAIDQAEALGWIRAIEEQLRRAREQGHSRGARAALNQSGIPGLQTIESGLLPDLDSPLPSNIGLPLVTSGSRPIPANVDTWRKLEDRSGRADSTGSNESFALFRSFQNSLDSVVSFGTPQPPKLIMTNSQAGARHVLPAPTPVMARQGIVLSGGRASPIFSNTPIGDCPLLPGRRLSNQHTYTPSMSAQFPSLRGVAWPFTRARIRPRLPFVGSPVGAIVNLLHLPTGRQQLFAFGASEAGTASKGRSSPTLLAMGGSGPTAGLYSISPPTNVGLSERLVVSVAIDKQPSFGIPRQKPGLDSSEEATPHDSPLGSFNAGRLLQQVPRVSHQQSPKPATSLSANERRVWDLSLDSGASSARLHIAIAAVARPRIVIPALRAATRALMERHPSLRTAYYEEPDGEPSRREVPADQCYLDVQVHRKLDRGIDFDLTHALNMAAAEPMPLSRGSLFRVCVFESEDLESSSVLEEPFRRTESEEEESVLLFVIHRIAADLWSTIVLLDDLRILYADPPKIQRSPTVASPIFGVSNAAATLPKLRVQVVEFRDWVERSLDGTPEGERLWNYWLRKLGGELPTLDLPTDFPRGLKRGLENGAMFRFSIDSSVMSRLTEFARVHGVTLLSILLAAWATLLHRYSNQEDVLISTPMACRNLTGLEDVVGDFVNPVVLRISLAPLESGVLPFGTLLQRCADDISSSSQHQMLPYQMLLKRLSRCPDGEQPCSIVDAELSLIEPQWHGGGAFGPLVLGAEGPGACCPFGESTLQALPISTPFFLPCDLSLNIAVSADSRHVPTGGLLAYDQDIFSEATARRISEHLIKLLTAVVEDPACPIRSLPILGASEELQLHEWAEGEQLALPEVPQVSSDAQTAEGGDSVAVNSPIIAMFDQQAARTPDKVALECGSDVLSYSQLQAVSHSVAHELRITGVQPYIDSVGICCGRSTAAYVSVLGTLRAGAAYVPLDPSYPSDRLRVMMEDSSPAVILVLEAYEDKLQADGFTLLRVDGILRISTAAQPATTEANVPYNLDAPAYIIFTSGSTGRPKGVVQSLRCLYNLICWQLGNGGLGHACRTLQFAPLSFDVHFQELFSAWVNGGSLVGIDESLRRDPPRLLQFISEQRIERIFAPFVALQHVSENFVPEDKLLLHLKQVITAGEQLQLTPSLLQLLAAVPGCELHNHYGPSETHVCTWHPLLGDPAGWVQRGALPPIGKPIANTRAYVVDPTSFQLVPIGIPGELLIGGACVAIGYKGRDDLTAERFLQDPFVNANEEGASRVYRTGDLVRWLPDGGLEFLGRIDGQVKVRGHRIEVGEIEAALGRHPLVRRVVVIARDVSGIKELVAYVVLNRSSQLAGTTEVPPTSVLRDHLRNIFPDYMVPSSIMVLEAFPLTPSGKVDRKALPEPDRERPDELGNALAGPRNDVERRLCAVWAEVLKLPADKVGVFDSFFELGGHSIAAMRLISRVRHELGANISIGAVFASEPTIAALAKHIASNCPVELSSELEIRAQETDVSKSPRARSPTIQLAPEHVLSFNQESMWISSAMDTTANIANNIPIAMHVRGEPLRLASLRSALRRVYERHSSLRTAYIEAVSPTANDQTGFSRTVSTQVLETNEATPTVLIHDIRGLTAEELAARVNARANLPFDLSRGQLLRVDAFSEEKSDTLPIGSVLLMTFHHICCDLWSLVLIFDELRQSMASPATDESHLNDEKSLTYEEYARQQRGTNSPDLDLDLAAYWHKELQGELPVLSLPTDRPRPPIKTYDAASTSLMLSKELTESLHRIAHAEGVTLFALLLAAWASVLHRYTGQDDILIGTPMACRSKLELESIVGYFVNPVCLRIRPSATMAFDHFLETVRQTVLEAMLHQDYPFSVLVERLLAGAPRDLSRSPLFQVMFVLQNTHTNDSKLGNLMHGLPGGCTEWGATQLETFGVEHRAAMFDLILIASECEVPDSTSGVLNLQMRYSTELFEKATVNSHLAHLQQLLLYIANIDGSSSGPSAMSSPIGLLPMLTDDEAFKLRCEFQGSIVDHEGTAWSEQPTTVTDMFERSANLRGEHLAVIDDTETLTYAQLNARADALCDLVLTELGECSQPTIGLRVDRSACMLIGQLACFKAAAAYSPIDPALPVDRVKFMLELIDAKMVLTDPVLMVDDEMNSTMTALHLTVLSIQDPRTANGTLSSVTRPVRTFDSVANVIFTSGSSGKPKGVMVEHHSLVNLIKWAISNYRMTTETRASQVLGVGFDPVFLEVWPALCCGASVYIVGAQTKANPSLLAMWLLENKISNTILPTALGEVYLAHHETSPFLRVLGMGGDVLKRSPPHDATFSLENMYGPTECTVLATRHTVRPGELHPPIGAPIHNYRVYVVEPKTLQIQLIGVPGELLIGGAGVARGYIARDDLTAERFLPDTFLDYTSSDAKVGRRIYRTGDLVRWLPNGELEFLGRIDGQVKIRGHRIELGEIDAVLLQQRNVLEAATVVRGDSTSSKRLIAYVAPIAGETLSVLELRTALSRVLAEYMRPENFVIVKRLPRTANDKIDYKQLPDPPARGANGDIEGQPQTGVRVRPRTGFEEVIHELWCGVLGLAPNQVGVHDQFFENGGHSLAAMLLISRIRHELNIEIPLTRFFETPTIAGLAAPCEAAMSSHHGPLKTINELLLTAEQSDPDELKGPSLYADGDVPDGAGHDAPLSHNQESLFFMWRMQPSSAAYNVVVCACEVLSHLDLDVLRLSMTQLCARHAPLRTLYPTTSAGVPVQRIASLENSGSALEFIELNNESHGDSKELMHKWMHMPFDLSVGPIIRVVHINGDTATHLLIVAHHICIDGWSVPIMLRELGALYTEASQTPGGAHGAPAALPPLGCTFAQYARWQRLFFSSGHDVSLESYWARELAGELPVLAIPTDMPRPVTQTFEGRSCSLSIPVPLAASLREIARAEGVTMFTLLLTTWACVLHRYTGQEDLLIGTPMACRSKIELEGVIGYFVNPVCLRIRPSAGVAFTRLLQHTRQTVLGAMLHQDYPFSVLAERLLADAPRDLSRSPLFQSMFSLEQSMDARASSSSCGDLTSFAIGSEGAEVSLGTLKLRALALEQHISQFDLTLSCREVEGEMSASLQYNAGLFLPSTAQRLLRHFLEILRAIAADPKCSVGKLPMLNREEKREMLDWGRGRSDYAVPETLVHKLQAQLEATPDALALQAYGSEALSLTYSELHARANGIAREILRLVGSRRTNEATPVAAVCTERSLHFVVALLAGLKAGCPYLPLDRTYPRDRLIHMLVDSAACVMLTTSTCFAEMKSVCPDNVDILCVDQLHPDSNSTTAVVSLSSLKPDNVAYLVYTSGSTGKPKAIEVPHSSLANLIAWHANEYSVIASDRASHLIGHGFDPTNLELWPFLAHGASVHVVPEARRADPTALLQFIREAKITICLLPTPLAELALHMRWPEGCEQFRVLYTGGEKLKAGATPAGAPHFRFDNHYGPAECTVMATVHTLRPKELHPPIGKPIGRALLYVVSPGSFELQPIGVAGELLIGGSLVAKGYVGRAKLTAEKFVPDAFANASGEVSRVYRTGDLVRWVPSGELEFLGRIDGQVKIRGHRIELGEIEAALLAIGFDAAAVIDVSVGDGDKKLAAYVVGSGPIETGADNDNSSPTIKWRRTAATTRRLLAEHLAEYMLPSSYMLLESLPLTSNQKVDRSKLPKPTFDDLDTLDVEEILPSETPSTNTEELLRAEFSELLGVEVSRIGVRSSFFALGGHSIAAARLAARCAAVFHVELPLPMVFSHPRLGDLAKIIDMHRTEGGAKNSGDEELLQIEADSLALPEEISCSATLEGLTMPCKWHSGHTVLLTGATGFLGAFLLFELLEQSTARVCCIVRAKSQDQALTRLIESVSSHGAFHQAMMDESRVSAIIGDLAQPQLGLTDETWNLLSQTTDTIYHCGSLVHFGFPYSALRAANVLGTIELLKLASVPGKPKRLHYISSLSVFGSSTETVGSETASLPALSEVHGGYSRSKWASEKLVALAASRGVPVCVHRPGRIVGHSISGSCNTDDFLFRMLKGCVQLGSYPSFQWVERAAPVDFVSSAIVAISMTAHCTSHFAYHQVHSEAFKWTDLFKWTAALGYRLECVELDVWVSQLESERDSGESSNAMLPLLPLLKEVGLEADVPLFSCENTLAALANTNVRCPPMDAALWARFVGAMQKQGFLHLPG